MRNIDANIAELLSVNFDANTNDLWLLDAEGKTNGSRVPEYSRYILLAVAVGAGLCVLCVSLLVWVTR
jgi:hypothetical protein